MSTMPAARAAWASRCLARKSVTRTPTCVRPVTLSIRLMINMAVDHLVGAIFLGMVAILVPLPLMFLAIIVVCVQTLVFCLLTSIYIGLATEKAEHH